MEKAFAIPISRRDFVKLAGLTAASSLLGIKDDAAKAEAASPAISALDYSKANLPILFKAIHNKENGDYDELQSEKALGSYCYRIHSGCFGGRLRHRRLFC